VVMGPIDLPSTLHQSTARIEHRRSVSPLCISAQAISEKQT
jgi:hypothetical protein